MAAEHVDVQLVGETVLIGYTEDPAVGYGRFRLENHGETPVTAVVESAWIELAGRKRPLPGISAFDLDREEAIDPSGFDVAGEAGLTFLMSFPSVVPLPGSGESVGVGLLLRVDGLVLRAVSPVRFERRIPKGH